MTRRGILLTIGVALTAGAVPLGLFRNRPLQGSARGWRIGRASRWLAPGFGDCGRCRTNWAFVHGHMTAFLWCDEESKPGPDGRVNAASGMFPLCEACWAELTPEERLPFYLATNESWSGYGYALPESVIRRSVLLEGQGPSPFGESRTFTAADGTVWHTTSFTAINSDDPVGKRWWCR